MNGISHIRSTTGFPGNAAPGNTEPQLGANEQQHAKPELGAPS